jgi:hypothetical protein
MSEHEVISETEMDRALAIKAALELLFADVPPHIWVYALQQSLLPTGLALYRKSIVETMSRQHADIMRRVEELKLMHSSTPTTNLYEFQQPSSLY